jgi:hypothetical protein
MDLETRIKFRIPENHTFKQTHRRMKGADEYFYYEQLDENSSCVAKWEEMELLKINGLEPKHVWKKI